MDVATEAVLGQVFRDHHAWLVRRLALVIGDPDEAQDIAQKVFVRLLERRPDVEGRSIGPWLAVVGVRLAISERRRRQLWGLFPLRETDKEWAIGGDPDLWAALARLDPRTRAALLLNVVDGYTQEEIAQAFAVPRGTVASWLSRGRQVLRPILSETLSLEAYDVK